MISAPLAKHIGVLVALFPALVAAVPAAGRAEAKPAPATVRAGQARTQPVERPADAGQASPPSSPAAKMLWAWVDAPDARAEALRRQLLDSGTDVDTAAAWLREGRPARPVEPRQSPWREIEVAGIDGRERAHVLRVPEGFKSWDRRHPLVVELHGGVAYPQPKSTKEMQETDYAFAGGLMDEAFYLQPKGTSAATWFDRVGADNVLRAIREVRRRYPIDPDRIFLGGFSDGGHGAYYFSAFHSTPFAGFLPLNGLPLGAQLRGRQVHLRNMTNKPMYVVATGRDFLAPPAAVKPFVEILRKLGTPLTYRVYEKMPHAPLYLTEDKELPKIAQWLKTTVREPYPRELVWETADLEHSAGLHWVHIRRIGDVGNDHPFPDVNARRGPKRVRLGVHVDPEWKKAGVKVRRLADGWPAAQMGVRVGDVIVKADGEEIRDRADLRKVLEDKSFEDAVRVSVRRAGRDEPLELEGRFPKDTRPNLLTRKRPYGSIRARREGNRFDVQVRNVGEFSLLLSPDVVDFAKPIAVAVNGREVFEQKVTPSLDATLSWARRLADPAQVYTAELRITVPAAETAPEQTDD